MCCKKLRKARRVDNWIRCRLNNQGSKCMIIRLGSSKEWPPAKLEWWYCSPDFRRMIPRNMTLLSTLEQPQERTWCQKNLWTKAAFLTGGVRSKVQSSTTNQNHASSPMNLKLLILENLKHLVGTMSNWTPWFLCLQDVFIRGRAGGIYQMRPSIVGLEITANDAPLASNG